MYTGAAWQPGPAGGSSLDSSAACLKRKRAFLVGLADTRAELAGDPLFEGGLQAPSDVRMRASPRALALLLGQQQQRWPRSDSGTLSHNRDAQAQRLRAAAEEELLELELELDAAVGQPSPWAAAQQGSARPRHGRLFRSLTGLTAAPARYGSAPGCLAAEPQPGADHGQLGEPGGQSRQPRLVGRLGQTEPGSLGPIGPSPAFQVTRAGSCPVPLSGGGAARTAHMPTSPFAPSQHDGSPALSGSAALVGSTGRQAAPRVFRFRSSLSAAGGAPRSFDSMHAQAHAHEHVAAHEAESQEDVAAHGMGRMGLTQTFGSVQGRHTRRYSVDPCTVNAAVHPQGLIWGQGLQGQEVEGRQRPGEYQAAGAYQQASTYQPAAGAQGRSEVWHAAAGHMHAPPDLPMDCMDGRWLSGRRWTNLSLDSLESAPTAPM